MTKTHARAAAAITPNPAPENLAANEGRNNSHQAPMVEDKGTYNSITTNTILTLRLDQPRRGRGRPKKTAAVDSSTQDEPQSTEAMTRKRARNDVSVDERETEPAKKRTKDIGHNENSPPSPQTKGKQGHKATVAPRDPLPDRPGRNVNPVPKTMTRRSETVRAEREAKAKELERRIRELEAAKRLLAEANMAEDVSTSSDYPTRLSAALRKHGRSEDDSGDGEHFDFQEVDKMSISSEDEESGATLVSIRDHQH